MHKFTVAMLATLGLTRCHPGDPEPTLADNFGVEETQGEPGCDNLLPACLFPFPSDAFSGAEGIELPRSPFLGSTTLSVESFASNKGFGAASPILFQLLDAEPPGEPFDSAPSLEPGHPTVLIDAATGEWIPHWVEHDYLSPELDPPLLVIRPAIPLPRGTEIVVGVRDLRDASGAVVEAPEAFRALRDQTASRWIGLHDRRAHFDEVVFPTLEAAGIQRGTLQLAWSFPVQSGEDATAPLLSVRDTIFDALPAGGPAYTIDAITVCDGLDDDPICHPSVRVIVDGTASIPSVIGPPDALGIQRLRTDGVGNPVVEGVEVWPFRLQLPHVAFEGDGPVPVMQYGHGFLGRMAEADNGWLRDMAERLGFAILACDMQGMNERDLTTWLAVMGQDGGRFPELQELAFQGIVNQLVQQRLVKTSLAEDPAPELRRADGQLAWDPSTVWYYGNSQGGSVGTLVTAVSLDIERGVLGVPGSGYPLLLHRSTVFSDFGTLLELTMGTPEGVSAFLAMLGTGWDASDPLTFAPHLHGDPLPNTPDHEVLFHVAKEDQQVHNEASFISGRAAYATLMVPAIRSVFGLPETPYPASPGAALVEVDFGVPDDPTPEDPPDGDASMPDGGDTHGWLRKWEPAQDQMVHFLRTGEMIDVCGGVPCVTGPQ